MLFLRISTSGQKKICTFERHAIKKVKKARFLTLTIVMENKYLIKIIK